MEMSRLEWPELRLSLSSRRRRAPSACRGMVAVDPVEPTNVGSAWRSKLDEILEHECISRLDQSAALADLSNSIAANPKCSANRATSALASS